MHLATSTGYGIYLIMWLPCLFLVAGVGLLSLYRQIRSGRGAQTIWKWQLWTLVVTAGIAITIHYVGYTQLTHAPESTNSRSLEEGMKIIRFVDIGYYVILGSGLLLLVATAAVRTFNSNNQEAQQAVRGNRR